MLTRIESTTETAQTPDGALLALFESRPQRAWELFIDKYSNLIFACLRRLGLDYDEAMERFVYVCEKLSEEDYRRLRGVKYLGQSGELTPWLVQVVRNLAVNFAQLQDGRQRLLKSIDRLGELDQKVFTAYFRQGLPPSEIRERLSAADNAAVRLVDVLDSLDRIFDSLSAKKLWRLVSNLERRRRPVSLVHEEGVMEKPVRCREASPEKKLLLRERRRQLRSALAELQPRARQLLRLRYEEGLSVRQAARLLDIGEREVKAALRSTRRTLRRRLCAAG